MLTAKFAFFVANGRTLLRKTDISSVGVTVGYTCHITLFVVAAGSYVSHLRTAHCTYMREVRQVCRAKVVRMLYYDRQVWS